MFCWRAMLSLLSHFVEPKDVADQRRMLRALDFIRITAKSLFMVFAVSTIT